MTVNPSGWRPTTPANEQGEAQTVTGNRALMLEEPLIFEIGSTGQTGVDFDRSPAKAGVQERRKALVSQRPGPRPAPGNIRNRRPSARYCRSRRSAAPRASARGCR
jgi:hypothetical protein